MASDVEVPPKWPFYLQLLSSYVTVIETTQRSDRKGMQRIRILFRAPIITCNVLSNCGREDVSRDCPDLNNTTLSTTLIVQPIFSFQARSLGL